MATTTVSVNTGTQNTTITVVPDSDADHFKLVCLCLTFLVIFLGVVGNTLSVIVFVKYRLSSGSVGQYLIALALADNIVLLSHLPYLISVPPIGYGFVHTYNWLCKSLFYFKYSGRIWSACLTLAITVERYLFVAHPIRRTYMQEHKIHRTLIPLTLTLSLVSVLYSPFLIQVSKVPAEMGRNVTTDVTRTKCFIIKETKQLFTTLDITIVRGIGDIFLGILIFIFTILTIRALLLARNERISNLEENSSNNHMLDSVNPRGRTQRRHSGSRESQITRMLLLVAVMFLVFKVPYTALYYATLNLYKKQPSDFTTAEQIMKKAETASAILGLVGYSFNFFVYVSLVPTFRKKLASLLKCK